MVQVKGYLTLIMWNMKTNELFNLYNNALKKRLLPEPTNREPIECDSFSDKYDDVINFNLEQHGIKS